MPVTTAPLLLVLDPSAGPAAKQLPARLTGSKLPLRSARGVEGALAVLRELREEASEPQVAVIAPGEGWPLAAGRRIRQTAPDVHIVFLTHAAGEEPLRRALLFDPQIGTPWSVLPLAEPGLEERLEEIALAAAQHRGHRQTIAGLNSRIAGFRFPRTREGLAAVEGQLATLMDHASDAIFACDPGGQITTWNVAAARLFGWERTPPREHCLELLLPEAGDSRRADLLRRTQAGEGSVLELSWPPRPPGACRAEVEQRQLEIKVAAIRSPEDAWLGMLFIAADVTERKREEARRRFLAEVGETLASSLDYDLILQRIAEIAVPALADYSLIDIVSEDGTIRRVSAMHRDPTQQSLLEELQNRYPPTWDSPQPAGRVLRSGQPELLQVTPEVLASRTLDPEHAGLLQRLDVCSHLSVPLRARGRILGAISLSRTSSSPAFAEPDLELAVEVARRAALAVDNARLYAELQVAARRKDEFLAMLAHELRNPLAPVLNAVELLRQSGAPNPVQERVMDVVERNIRHLTRLVDDLLDVSRITRGKVELRREPVDLARVAEHAAQLSMPLIEARGHRLSISLPRGPVPVEADPVRLEQVISNLLNNAAKYTEPGGQIWLSVEFQTADHGSRKEAAAADPKPQAIIRVRDTGRGIPKELLGSIFDLFLQVDPAVDRAQGGLGLGLTLVKELVEMHGGTTEARSEGPGRGSEFVVRLPLGNLERLAESGKAREPRTASPVRRAAQRILVVDDNVDAAETLGELLEGWGYEVRLAHTGPAALEAAAEYRPHVALLDIGLPGLDGYAVARKLREEPATRRCRVIALTGYGQEQDREQSEAAGFEAHLVKPVDLGRLHSLLEQEASRTA